MPLDQSGGGRGNGGGRGARSLNVMGGELQVCSLKPMTGFFRNGCCDTNRQDVGSHTVCVVMTERKRHAIDLVETVPPPEPLRAYALQRFDPRTSRGQALPTRGRWN